MVYDIQLMGLSVECSSERWFSSNGGLVKCGNIGRGYVHFFLVSVYYANAGPTSQHRVCQLQLGRLHVCSGWNDGLLTERSLVQN